MAQPDFFISTSYYAASYRNLPQAMISHWSDSLFLPVNNLGKNHTFLDDLFTGHL